MNDKKMSREKILKIIEKTKSEKLKTIDVSGKKNLGAGDYGSVFEISPRRVVKAYLDPEDSYQQTKLYVIDEFLGSLEEPIGLPCLDIVKVKHGRTKTFGVVKRKLKRFLNYNEENKIPECFHNWDEHEGQYMADSRGNIFKVDCQSELASDISDECVTDKEAWKKIEKRKKKIIRKLKR
jgi:hypothetical protein